MRNRQIGRRSRAIYAARYGEPLVHPAQYQLREYQKRKLGGMLADVVQSSSGMVAIVDGLVKRDLRRWGGGRRSGGCSTRRGDNPRMNSFGLWRQRHGHGGGWPGNRRGGGKRAGETVVGKNSGA